MTTLSSIQELASNLEIDNSCNKSHTKIFEFTVNIFADSLESILVLKEINVTENNHENN